MPSIFILHVEVIPLIKKSVTPVVKEASKKSTLVIKFFLTLRSVNINCPRLTIEGVESRLRTVMPKVKVISVLEFHKSGDTHFHVLIVSLEGLRKNTYKKEFRGWFPEFEGKLLDVTGVKSISNSVNYIVKDVEFEEVMRFLKTGECRRIYQNDKKYWLKLLKGRDIIQLKPAIIGSTMQDYNSIEQWRVSSPESAYLYANKAVAINHIWRMVQRVKGLTPVVAPFVEKALSQRDESLDAFLEVTGKYGLRRDHLAALRHILFGLLVREKFCPQVTKGKRLIIRGDPNTGKTSLFTALRNLIGGEGFYQVGSRKNDFSGYKRAENPIVIWDDCFGNAPGTEARQMWSKHALLKLLGREKIKVDVKYREPVEVRTPYNVVVTNDVRLFQTCDREENLKARLKLIHFPPGMARWCELSIEEIELLVVTALVDLLARVEIPRLSHFINYGINHQVKVKSRWYNQKNEIKYLYGVNQYVYREGYEPESQARVGSSSDFHVPKEERWDKTYVLSPEVNPVKAKPKPKRKTGQYDEFDPHFVLECSNRIMDPEKT